jgi:hypothetical protein
LDYGYAIAVDASGSSYTTGKFQGSMTVGDTTLTYAGGSEDIFIIKLDSSGSPVWARDFGGTGFDFGLDIAVDASGSSYTTGSFQGSMTVGDTTLTSAGGSQDIFIIKLDSSGSPVWARDFGGTSLDYGYAIAVDESGSSYTTGYFQGSMTVGKTTLTSAGGSVDIFIIKLDSSGSPVWARDFGGTSTDNAYHIAVDESGSSYTTGSFQGSMTVGDTTLTSAGGSKDIFIIKLDSSGSPVWARDFGGINVDIGLGIAVDASGSSYTTGPFQGSMTVGDTTLTSAGGSQDIFIIKLDSSGSPVWARDFGGINVDIGRGIAVDASGSSYTTGYFEGSMTVSNTTLTSAGGSDIFIIKLES